jgi:hypothetical protein
VSIYGFFMQLKVCVHLWFCYMVLHPFMVLLHSPSLKVAIFEANAVGFGAIGRNGGWWLVAGVWAGRWVLNDCLPNLVALQKDWRWREPCSERSMR